MSSPMPLPEDEARKTSKTSALIVAILTAFLNPFMISAINIAMPAIQREFGANAVALSWVATAYLLAIAVFLVPAGKLGDIYGRKRIFFWGILILTIASAVAAASVSLPMLIAARVVQGCGSAMNFATGIAIITSVFPPEERGKVLGLHVAAIYAGLSCGPFFGGLMTQHLSWRSIFIYCIPVGLAVLAMVIFKIRGEWAEARGERFDLTGSVIYAAALVMLMNGISLLPAASSAVLIGSGLAALAGFASWELRVKHPVFDVRLFTGNRVFALSCLSALINYSATFAVTFLLSLYLQYIKGLSAQGAGMILIAQPVVMAICSPFAGKLSDRVEPRILASGGMGLTAVGLGLLASIGDATPIGFIVFCLVILGLGFGLFSSPNMNAIMSSVEKRHYGIASGSVGTMRVLGQMVSMGIATIVFAVFLGRVQISPELYPAFVTSVKIAFAVFFILCTGGIFSSLARGRLRS
jgi:EmrB/QacA subfamily drug resistance transporter